MHFLCCYDFSIVFQWRDNCFLFDLCHQIRKSLYAYCYSPWTHCTQSFKTSVQNCWSWWGPKSNLHHFIWPYLVTWPLVICEKPHVGLIPPHPSPQHMLCIINFTFAFASCCTNKHGFCSFSSALVASLGMYFLFLASFQQQPVGPPFLCNEDLFKNVCARECSSSQMGFA